jgi:hypothetical protein
MTLAYNIRTLSTNLWCTIYRTLRLYIKAERCQTHLRMMCTPPPPDRASR